MFLHSFIITCLAVGLSFHQANAIGADDSGWRQVNFEVNPVPTSNPCPLTIKAEQAQLESEKVGGGKWYGYGGPMNTHTRRLSFVVNNNESFDVPDAFVSDLLNLKIDDLAHISLDGENTVLIMHGAGGEKSYEVLFHFKGKRLAQRILEYSEARYVYIKENR
jgi:hypothetical protein